MSDADAGQIWILGAVAEAAPPGRVERGVGRPAALAATAVDVSVLRKNMQEFLAHLREVISADGLRVGAYTLEQVEVNVQLTATGQVCLLGSGVSVQANGGLKLILKRSPA